MWDRLIKDVKDTFFKPSLVKNLVKKNKWNEGLSNFGGFADPRPRQQDVRVKGMASPLPKTQSLAIPQQMPKVERKITPQRLATPTPMRRVLSAPTPTPVLDELESRTLPTFKQHKVHPSIAYGIASAEGGKIGDYNVWNMNATDANPQGAYNYDSYEAAATDAAKLMVKMIDKMEAQGATPEEQLVAIQNAGYAGDPKTWKQRSIDTGGAGIHYDSWSDFVKATKGWKKWSK